MAKSFYKIVRSQETLDLLKYPYEFTLFALIAYRARRKNGSNINNLEVGEALMGDYENHGATEQRYRTAKNNLERWGFITNKATNKGTIIKVINTDIFDINEEQTNGQTNETSTSHQRAINEQPNEPATTNNKDKNKEDNKENNIPDAGLVKFEKFWKIYPARNGKKIGKDKSLSLFSNLSAKNQDAVLIAVENYASADTGYSVDPVRFFKSNKCPNGLWREWLEPAEEAKTPAQLKEEARIDAEIAFFEVRK